MTCTPLEKISKDHLDTFPDILNRRYGKYNQQNLFPPVNSALHIHVHVLPIGVSVSMSKYSGKMDGEVTSPSNSWLDSSVDSHQDAMI